MIAALDAWFDRVAGAVHAFGGEVLKFIGDGVLAIFPVTGAPAEACEAALRAVVAARAGMAHLDAVRQAQGLPPLPFGAALHVGEMLWGNIGAADRLDFTAIGPAVNLVSRLEGLCRPLGRSVLISGAVAAEITTPLVPLGEHVLRGIAAPCAVFTLPRWMSGRRRRYIVGWDRLGELSAKPANVAAATANPTLMWAASCRVAEVDVLEDLSKASEILTVRNSSRISGDQRVNVFHSRLNLSVFLTAVFKCEIKSIS